MAVAIFCAYTTNKMLLLNLLINLVKNKNNNDSKERKTEIRILRAARRVIIQACALYIAKNTGPFYPPAYALVFFSINMGGANARE